MSDVLQKIVADKRREVDRRQAATSLAEVQARARDQAPARGFATALRAALDAGRYGLITEIKRASPSKGLIRADFDPPSLARAYAAGGATCLSVLTDGPYFQGEDAHLQAARAAVPLPVLRKDFTIDAYQIWEARALGADCVLLIVAALTDEDLQAFCGVAREAGVDVLVEVHDAAELDRALRLDAALLGINNRNLKTLAVDLATTEALAPQVPDDRVLICESGLFTPDDLARMAGVGARCFLVGESLMRQADVTAATRALLADPAARRTA